MHRILLLVLGAVVVVKVAASDPKQAARPVPAQVAPPVAAVRPPPPPPTPSLAVAADDLAESDVSAGMDVDVVLEQARIATSGALEGNIRDRHTGDPLAGVTVVARSPRLPDAQVALTDETGRFRLVDLPTGTYDVSLYYLDATVAYPGIAIAAGETAAVFPTLDVIDFEEGSIVVESTIELGYVQTIPVPPRTFESVLESAELADEQDVTLSSSDTLENTYIVDGE